VLKSESLNGGAGFGSASGSVGGTISLCGPGSVGGDGCSGSTRFCGAGEVG